MNARNVLLFTILSVGAFQAKGAIYQYVFEGMLESEVPTSESNSVAISAPIYGVLTLDTANTGDSDLLIPDNFADITAELSLIVGTRIQISASGSTLSGSNSTATPAGHSEEELFAEANFGPHNIVSSEPGSFPSTLAVMGPNNQTRELPLQGIDISFNPATLASLGIGDESGGGISGTFSFGAGVGSQAFSVNFTSTKVSRTETDPRIQREWNSLKSHVARLGEMEDMDDLLFSIRYQNGGGDNGDGGDGGIIVIPEAGAMPFLLGLLVSLPAFARRRS
jgi:hypothetical protein